MRVSLVGPTHPYRGGISHHTTLLCEALKKDHEVQFISYKRQYPAILFPGKSDKDPSADGLHVEGVDFLVDSVNPFTWLQTARAVVRFKPDLLVLPWWVVFWAPLYLVLITWVRWFLPTRVVFLCHNVLEHEPSALKRAITRLTLSRADRIVTQSQQESEKAKALLGADFPVVTGFHPTYVSLAGGSMDREQAVRELNLSGNVLLFFGFVRPYKGLDVLLEAMPSVLASRDVTLMVVGEFWKDKDAYLEQLDRLGLGEHVRLVDEYVPNEHLGRYFAAADLVVQPYRSASGSGVSQLAYGFGKPVVATRVGNLAEVIEDGRNGLLVPPSDAAALADALVRGLDGPKLAELTDNARLTKERFSWDRLVALICDAPSG
ncbi:glycosyl transferase group 1 [Pseudodesulfovibrio mercurii]|uniref:Glycosyl transferase group 1 n=1 Tax=Pseudodesulfovibrio mercurii TaxID=641491 RepID=F0JE82_9BACT|nr:glycosyltransferase [Pseudodesulfovibrio mercurii]EGB14691.1 glycosyl transferase group 1 [Pseudodesulfovibrio mercurii]